MDKLIRNLLKYPETRMEPVVETIHGIKITDNYRWLEKIDSREVQSWIKAQNDLSRSILDQIPIQSKIYKRVNELIRIEETFLPKETEKGWFYNKKHPDAQQPIIYFRSKDTGIEKVFLDVNKMDPTGLSSIDIWEPSPNGDYFAYGVSEKGSEWNTIYIMRVSDKILLEDQIQRIKPFSPLVWNSTNSGLYYMRFPNPKDVPAGEENFHSHIRYHQIGTAADEDPTIYRNPEKIHEYPFFSVSPDESFMIITSYRFTESDLYCVDLKTLEVNPILVDSEWLFEVVVGKEYIYIKSNHKNPHFSLFRTKLDKLDIANWQEIIVPRDNDTLETFLLVKEKPVVKWLRHVSNLIEVYNPEGDLLWVIDLPNQGTISTILNAYITFERLSLHYTSWVEPPFIINFNVETGQKEKFTEKKVPNLDLDSFKVKHEWYISKDGTKVHMFIIHKKDLNFNGNNPTILYGYGGFGVSLTPSFSVTFLSWIELGGVVAIANLRGGGEFGDDWHKAGRLGNKQNVFDDFIAAAEFLIQERYCSSKCLGIYGGSNGGLLVGAAAIQRPDLFSAVYCSVPLLDMLRYQNSLLGATWIPEYGDPTDPKQFSWLYEYSPYHNAKQGPYPTIMFHTAESDSRVDPMHAMKMAALLQSISTSKNPILLWVETAAGHGIGMPTDKLIQRATDVLTFFSWGLYL